MTTEPAATGTARGPVLAAEYFDGRTARAHAIQLQVVGGQLHIGGSGVALAVPVADVQWPESTGRGRDAGTRVAHLKAGGSLHGEDGEQWDAWARASGLAEPLVVKVQRSWSWTLVACSLLLTVVVAGYLWGVPLAVRGVLALTPASVDRAVGETAWQSVIEPMLLPSTLAPAQQQRLRAAFGQAVQQAWPDAAQRPAYDLRFHTTRDQKLGPNAFALPGGRVVMTDELVRLVDGDEAVVIGVLAHELGHVRHRHGMQALARGALLTVATSVALGDVSSLLAALPAVLGQLGYSRDFEREADQEAVRVLRAAGHSPAVMVVFFEKVGGWRRSGGAAAPAAAGASVPGRDSDAAARDARRGRDELPIAISSHPADAERIRFFMAHAR